MAVIEGRTFVEHLSQRECWDLLSGAGVGRIGVLVDSAPEIYPVNFAVDGTSLVFRTDAGSKLRGLDRSPSVCLEVDGFDLENRKGWSVLVKGRAAEIADAAELRHARELPLRLWGLGPKSHWIRLRPSEVTGRRIDRVQERSS